MSRARGRAARTSHCWSSLRQPRRAGKWTNSAHRPGQPSDAKDRKAPGPKRSNWMSRTVVSSHSKELVIGFDQPFCIIGERINPTRSEEHTSELQSLMRISYAVFCLKKKKEQIKKTATCRQPINT